MPYADCKRVDTCLKNLHQHAHFSGKAAIGRYGFSSSSPNASVEILRPLIQRDFCSHFRPISWTCFLFQLSHFIWCSPASGNVGSSPSTLCHCYWCRLDFHEAMMRSHSLKRNIFHWAKSQRMVQWIVEGSGTSFTGNGECTSSGLI